MSEQNYEDNYDDNDPLPSSGGLAAAAGMVASVASVLAWVVLGLGIIQIGVQLFWQDAGSSLPFRSIVLIVTTLWEPVLAWGVLMVGAIVCRYVSHRAD